jgi:glycosyltransferase involved in cell wall biosynthesis
MVLINNVFEHIMEKSKSLVSIIMNCYNGQRHLKEAIDSIYQQDYHNWEIIFWDNASDDDSAKVAKSYDKRLKYFLAPINTSLGEARNIALQKACGKYVAFLDCDDKYLPEKLTRQVNMMEINQYALCYGSAIVINEDGAQIKKNIVTDKHGYILDQLLLKYEINMQTVMIRRNILTENSLSFDTKLQFSPDYDLFMRIAAEHKICSLSSYLAEYRKGETSLTVKMLDRIAPEMEYTLKNLSTKSNISSKINHNFKVAFQMLYFYRSLPLIQSGQYLQARKNILKSIKVKKVYIIYYLILFLPVNRTWLLKLMM